MKNFFTKKDQYFFIFLCVMYAIFYILKDEDAWKYQRAVFTDFEWVNRLAVTPLNSSLDQWQVVLNGKLEDSVIVKIGKCNDVYFHEFKIGGKIDTVLVGNNDNVILSIQPSKTTTGRLDATLSLI